MYLTKATMRQSVQAAKEFLSIQSNGPYASHQLIWTLFESTQEDRSFLFREETTASGQAEFYILSDSKPLQDSPILAVQSKPFSPYLEAGMRLAFRLRVNPTVTTKNEDGKQKRHDVMMHAKHIAKESGEQDPQAIKDAMECAAKRWICHAERLHGWGISLDVEPEVENYTQHRSKKGNSQAIRFSSVDYQGLLTVQDPERFLNQLSRGFGHAKGFGCGLMLIKKVG
ncbi:type I-E CRISPR-associated protein Cas6/Cse3/CasE [Reinekea sp. G2M2-21]|uniref:type I-E CRISPR-associated protein Cas6/Cse3/CasE n=1 Tax=Reinekea sp. G2M2-21 TaxID=2788942 RepID=UPI0018AC5D9D